MMNVKYSITSHTSDCEKVTLTNCKDDFDRNVEAGAIILFHPSLVEPEHLSQSGLANVYLFGTPKAKLVNQFDQAMQIVQNGVAPILDNPNEPILMK